MAFSADGDIGSTGCCDACLLAMDVELAIACAAHLELQFAALNPTLQVCCTSRDDFQVFCQTKIIHLDITCATDVDVQFFVLRDDVLEDDVGGTRSLYLCDERGCDAERDGWRVLVDGACAFLQGSYKLIVFRGDGIGFDGFLVAVNLHGVDAVLLVFETNGATKVNLIEANCWDVNGNDFAPLLGVLVVSCRTIRDKPNLL